MKEEIMLDATYAWQKSIQPLKTGIMRHGHNVNHLINFALNRFLIDWNEQMIRIKNNFLW